MAEVKATLLKPGTVLKGRYAVVRLIGRGGMAEVYEVTDGKTGGRSRALKVLYPQFVTDAMLERFRQESGLPAKIESPNIVDVFDQDVDDDTGFPFFVMELLRGEDLETRLERAPLSAEETVAHLHRASLAIECAHAADVVHRDLKPANLFVTTRPDGSEDLKVLDFGVAKIVSESSRPKTTLTVGTPLYMSPEQILGSGHIGPSSDVYSLGHVAFALLVGSAYWEPDLEELAANQFLTRVAQGAVEPATARAARAGASLPTGFDAWFAKATAVLPGDRYDSASELVAELAAALGVALPRWSRPSFTARRYSADSSPTLLSSRPAGLDAAAAGRRLESGRVHSTVGVSSASRKRDRTSLGRWLLVGVACGALVGLGVYLRTGALARPEGAESSLRQPSSATRPTPDPPRAPAPGIAIGATAPVGAKPEAGARSDLPRAVSDPKPPNPPTPVAAAARDKAVAPATVRVRPKSPAPAASVPGEDMYDPLAHR